MTPNLAYGYNAAFQAAVSLTNQLYEMIHSNTAKEKGDYEKPSLAEIEKAFAAYQAERFGPAKSDLKMSALNTRMCAWDTVTLKYMSKIMPNILPLSIFMKGGYAYVKRGKCLEFLDKPDHVGMRFDDELDPVEAKKNAAKPNVFIVLSAAAVLLLAAGFALFVNIDYRGRWNSRIRLVRRSGI
jgi:hypothetical protein